jgi:hypothetical protein
VIYLAVDVDERLPPAQKLLGRHDMFKDVDQRYSWESPDEGLLEDRWATRPLSLAPSASTIPPQTPTGSLTGLPKAAVYGLPATFAICCHGCCHESASRPGRRLTSGHAFIVFFGFYSIFLPATRRARRCPLFSDL